MNTHLNPDCAKETPHPRIVLFYNQPYDGMLDGIAETNDDYVFTTDARHLSRAAAVVFHLPTLDDYSFPPKAAGQRWVAWSMESQVNYPILTDASFMRRFDITMTYDRSATVWCPYFGPNLADALRQPAKPKTEQAPVAYFRSSPIDRSGRGRYAFELMQ